MMISAGPYTLDIPANGVAILYEVDADGNKRQMPGGVGYLDVLVQFAGELIKANATIAALRSRHEG